MVVSVFEEFEGALSEEWLRQVALLALAPERLPAAFAPVNGQPVAVSVVVADDATLRELNREFHGEDELTDVLSFPLLGPERATSAAPSMVTSPPSLAPLPFVVPRGVAGVPLQLGEVILSYPQAVRQAQAAGHAVQREVALLVAHGVLHLLGYDHAAPQEKAIMWRKQDSVLGQLFPSGAPPQGPYKAVP